MKIIGNKNNVIINSNNAINTNDNGGRRKKITIVTVISVIAMLIGIYTDVYDHIVNYIKKDDKLSPREHRSLNYDHATMGNNSKERKD
jgi:hypothetical protein